MRKNWALRVSWRRLIDIREVYYDRRSWMVIESTWVWKFVHHGIRQALWRVCIWVYQVVYKWNRRTSSAFARMIAPWTPTHNIKLWIGIRKWQMLWATRSFINTQAPSRNDGPQAVLFYYNGFRLRELRYPSLCSHLAHILFTRDKCVIKLAFIFKATSNVMNSYFFVIPRSCLHVPIWFRLYYLSSSTRNEEPLVNALVDRSCGKILTLWDWWKLLGVDTTWWVGHCKVGPSVCQYRTHLDSTEELT